MGASFLTSPPVSLPFFASFHVFRAHFLLAHAAYSAQDELVSHRRTRTTRRSGRMG